MGKNIEMADPQLGAQVKHTIAEVLNQIEVDTTRDDLTTYLKPIFEKSEITLPGRQMEVNDQIFTDLEMFTGDHSVFKELDQTQTVLGSEYLKLMIQSPLSNSQALDHRQKVIKSLVVNQTLMTEANAELEKSKKAVPSLLGIWKPQTQETQNLIDLVYFRNSYLGSLNGSARVLNVSSYMSLYVFPGLQLLSPIMPFLSLYLIGKQIDPNLSFSFVKDMLFEIYNVKTQSKFHLFGLLVWALIYVYSTYTSITHAILQWKVIKLIHNQIYELTQLKNHCRSLLTIYRKLIASNQDPTIDLNRVDEALQAVDEDLCVTSPSTIFDDKGYALSVYHKIKQCPEFKRNLSIIAQFVGYFDCLMSIVSLSQQGYAIVDFLNLPKPQVTFSRIWHPCLDRKKSVPNTSSVMSHRIITGPNAGGKSTYIKNVALSILLAQTLTVANAHQVQLTPFSMLHSYIHLVDQKGSASLFEVEMNRCHDFIERVSELSKQSYIFAIFDELFTSTNFYEGISGAYAICLEMAKYPNLLTLMTTHYSQLTELSTRTGNRFQNFKVSVQKSDTGQIEFDYKIRRGISDQFIALDLLKLKGFNSEIIFNATQYLNEMKQSV